MPVQLIPLPHGAALHDPALVSAAQVTDLVRRGLSAVSTPLAGVAGREGVRVLHLGSQKCVWRHYRRGGWPGKVIRDAYLWRGAERTRVFREWRLLHEACELGLPVPRPVAGLYQRRGLAYRCDLLTALLPDTVSLGARLRAGPVTHTVWRGVGECIRRFHSHGVDHADLNVHNLLLDATDRVFLIDFDRGRFRRPGPWAEGNWKRLRRSLNKLNATLPPGRFGPSEWQALRHP